MEIKIILLIVYIEKMKLLLILKEIKLKNEKNKLLHNKINDMFINYKITFIYITYNYYIMSLIN